MIDALLLSLMQPDSGARQGPDLVVEEGTDFVFTCGDPTNNEAEIAACEAEEAECIDPQAQQTMNMCAARDFEAADAALNEQWLLTVAAMRAADTEVGREDDEQPGYYETLLDAQRAWLRFRDAQCLIESFEARGGSMQPMLHSFCMTHLTELRTQQLRDMAAGPEGE